MQNLLNQVIREVGAQSRINAQNAEARSQDRKDKQFQREMFEKQAKLDSANTAKNFENQLEMYKTQTGIQNQQQLELLRTELEQQSKRDSSRFAQEIAKMKIKSDENVASLRAQNDALLERIKLEYGLDEKKVNEQIKREKDKLKKQYIAPNFRARPSVIDFLGEQRGIAGLGFNESDLITAYQDFGSDLASAVMNVNSLGLAPDNVERVKLQNLVMDLYKQMAGSDMGADFLDGGGFLGALGLSDDQKIGARAVFDDVEGMLQKLGVPESEYKNRLFVK